MRLSPSRWGMVPHHHHHQRRCLPDPSQADPAVIPTLRIPMSPPAGHRGVPKPPPLPARPMVGSGPGGHRDVPRPPRPGTGVKH